MKNNRVKNESENLQLLSTLFHRNKDFISQESPILADVENIIFHWIRIISLHDKKLDFVITRNFIAFDRPFICRANKRNRCCF